MKKSYLKKSGASVLRMLDASLAEIALPGLSEHLLVDLNDPQQVAPTPLTTLGAAAGATGDVFLTPSYMSKHGLRPDAFDPKYPVLAGGSYAELWRSWALFRRLDASGPVAESLRTLRGEVRGGKLAACAARFAAGDVAGASAELDGLAAETAEDSKVARSARNLLAPGDRSDPRKVASVLQSALVGILAGAV